MDIDIDIEKQITQLQEGRINGSIKPITKISIDPDKQLKQWNLEKGFESFLTNIKIEKEDLSKKIIEEEKKINALEGLFSQLTDKKKPKKKKQLLAEPEKPKVEPVKEEIKPITVDSVKEKVFVDEEARKIIFERYGNLNQGFPLPKEIQYDPNIIKKVQAQISEMKVANELEKDKMTGLKSIDTLDKLTREFLNFKHVTSMQMGTIGGGGEVRLEFLDDVQKSTAVVDGKFLKYSSSAGKFIGADADAAEFSGVTAGTVTASKGVIVDSNKDIDGFRNVTIEGNLTVEGTTTTIDSTTIQIQNSFKFEGATDDAHETNLTTIDPTADRTISLPNVSGTLPVLAAVSATQITSTPEELNLLDGVSGLVQADLTKLAAIDATAAEINLIDGGTSRGTTAVADGDGILINDGGVMRMTTVQTVSTYMAAESVGGGNMVTVGALDSGSITSGFGTIDTGASTITTTGLISGGSLDIDNVLINGTTIGHTDDTDLITVADGLVTVAGEISVTTLDIGGTNVTSTAAELNLLDGVSGLVQADLTKLAAVDSTAAEINLIDGGTSRGTTAVASGDGILINDGGVMRMTNVDTVSTYFASHTVGGGNIVTTGALNSGSITSGFGTIDTGASTITTTGLISGGSLDIDNVLINGTTIGHTDDTDLMTVADGLLTVAGEVQMTTLDIGGTNVTSTAAELNILDGVTATTAELNLSDLATLGTSAASKVLSVDANNLTIISGAVLNTEDALSDGADIAWNVINSPVAKVTLAGNRSLSAPSGSTPAAGQFVSILVIQDGTGSRTLTFNAVYEFKDDTAPTLTTTAAKGDLFTFRYNGAKWLEVGRNTALTLS